MASVEAAKSYLMKANPDGVSLYDHLSEVLSKLLVDKPENALESLEAISAQIKSTRFTSGGGSSLKGKGLDARTLARVQEIEALLKPPKAVVDADGNMDVPPKNVLAKPKAVSILEASELADKAGVGLGKTEMYKIALAIKALGEDSEKALISCRFWGKIYGTAGDYLIAEAETGERDSTLPPLSDEEIYEQQVVVPEAPGVGANKYVYYVCSAAGTAWTRLPDVTPAQLMAAKGIKKLFSGDLAAPVKSYPPFPGNEAEYLRAQITRITVDTAIAPVNYYAEVEEEEEEAEEAELIIYNEDRSVNEPDLAKLKAKHLVAVADGHKYKDTELKISTPGEEYEPVTDMAAVADPEQWVKTTRPLLSKQGRCSWFSTPKIPKPPPAEDEELEEEAEEEPEEPEEPASVLSALSEDPMVAGETEEDEGAEPAWRFRQHMANGGGVHGKSTVVSVKSVKWPGAVTLAGFGGPHGMLFAGMYIGNGAEYKATTAGVTAFSPPLPAPVQTEWAPSPLAEDADEEQVPFTLEEQTDASVAEEEEDAQRKAAELESAVPAEDEEAE